MVTDHRKKKLCEPIKIMFRDIKRIADVYLDINIKAIYHIHSRQVARENSNENLKNTNRIKL